LSSKHYLFETKNKIKVTHDLNRQILEILSLIRVINNFYYKKKKIQEQIKPTILNKFREELKVIKNDKDWLFSIPSLLSKINEDFISKKKSFRFPDSIILFSAWMTLGIDALYPQVVFHFKFPGFQKGEETRHIFQFIFSTSRGLGFPIFFHPYFYGYRPKFIKYLNPLFKWIYKISHWINILIFRLESRFNMKRHHPGEFESVIISEYKNNVYKGIDTLVHGYFTNESKILGKFSSLDELLKKITFSYSIGDHAMSIINKNIDYILEIPMIDNEFIKEEFEIDFYKYIKSILDLNQLLNKKLLFYKNKRKNLIRSLSFIEKIKFRLYQSNKLPILKKNTPIKYNKIEKSHKNKHLIEKLKELLWNTPLYSHTIHEPSKIMKILDFPKKLVNLDEFEYEIKSTESIFLTFIELYEEKEDFEFKDKDLIKDFKGLRNKMAKMWLFFKERFFKYATNTLNKINDIPPEKENYKEIIKKYIIQLIPIIAIYEIFSRPLSESVYPEAIPPKRLIWAYLAKFLTSKYNLIGLNLIKYFNKLAFNNWAFYIINKGLNKHEIFDFILNLSIWKHIPNDIKKILFTNSK